MNTKRKRKHVASNREKMLQQISNAIHQLEVAEQRVNNMHPKVIDLMAERHLDTITDINVAVLGLAAELR